MNRFATDDLYVGDGEYTEEYDTYNEPVDDGDDCEGAADEGESAAVVTIRAKTADAKKAKSDSVATAKAHRTANEERAEAAAREAKAARVWLAEQLIDGTAMPDAAAVTLAEKLKARKRQWDIEIDALRAVVADLAAVDGASHVAIVDSDCAVVARAMEGDEYFTVTIADSAKVAGSCQVAGQFAADVAISVEGSCAAVTRLLKHGAANTKAAVGSGVAANITWVASHLLSARGTEEALQERSKRAGDIDEAAEAAASMSYFEVFQLLWARRFDGEVLPPPAHGINVTVNRSGATWAESCKLATPSITPFNAAFYAESRDLDVDGAELARQVATAFKNKSERRLLAMQKQRADLPPDADPFVVATVSRNVSAAAAALEAAKRQVDLDDRILESRRKAKAMYDAAMIELAQQAEERRLANLAREEECLRRQKECNARNRNPAQGPYVGKKKQHNKWAAEAATDPTEVALMRLSNALEGEHQLLTITGVALGRVPPSIAQVASITHLDLSSCELTELPPLGDMRLQKVYLSGNRLQRFPEALLTEGTIAGLRVLDLARNELTGPLPDAVGNMVSLEVLQLEYNRIDELPDLARLSKLEVLELTDNNIRTVPASVANLDRLWRLKLGANPMEAVPPEVYHQGLVAVKKYLAEASPHNLPVPASTLFADVVTATQSPALADVILIASYDPAAVDDGDRAASATVALEPCAHRIRTLAALVNARAPGLVPLAKCAGGDDVGDAEAVWTAPVSCKSATLAVFARLLTCEATREEAEALEAADLVELSTVVEGVGSAALRSQFQAMLRGKVFDADRVLGADLRTLSAKGTAAPPGPEGHAVAKSIAAASASQIGRFVRFTVGAEEELLFPVSRSLLVARSEYFARMLASGLAESHMAHIPLPDVDPDIFRLFLEYVHTDAPGKVSPDNAVALLFLASEYGAQRLRAMAECAVGFGVDVDNVAQVLQVAHFVDSDRLKRACLFFSARNHRAVRASDGFSSLDPELRDAFFDKVKELKDSKLLPNE